jgi:hypothetical protein
VFVVRNTPESVFFFDDVFAQIQQPVPSGIHAPRENARVIAKAQTSPDVRIVDQRRNNSVDPHLDDYCRHYVWASPMGQYYHKNTQERRINQYLKRRRWFVLRVCKVLGYGGISLYHPEVKHRVDKLYRSVSAKLPKRLVSDL